MRALPAEVPIALIASIALATLTYVVITEAAINALDLSIVLWAEAHRTPSITPLMVWASRLGGPSIVSAYAALMILACIVRRQLLAAVATAVVVYGGVVLNVAVKTLVHRVRPVTEHPLVRLETFSYPSGHAAASMIFGGLLIIALRQTETSFSMEVVVRSLIALWVALVCCSRVYLGAHYPTDVVAGLLEAILWLALATLALRRMHVPLCRPIRATE